MGRYGDGFGGFGRLCPLHRAGEELEEVVEHGALVRTQLAVDARDHLRGTRTWLMPRCSRLDRATSQPADQLSQPLGGSRPLFIARLAGAGVRQLLRNFGKVDLEVVNKDIVHGVLSSDFQLSKLGQKVLSRAVRRMFVERLTVYKDVTGAKAIMAKSRPPPGPVIFIDC